MSAAGRYRNIQHLYHKARPTGANHRGAEGTYQSPDADLTWVCERERLLGPHWPLVADDHTDGATCGGVQTNQRLKARASRGVFTEHCFPLWTRFRQVQSSKTRFFLIGDPRSVFCWVFLFQLAQTYADASKMAVRTCVRGAAAADLELPFFLNLSIQEKKKVQNSTVCTEDHWASFQLFRGLALLFIYCYFIYFILSLIYRWLSPCY